MEQITFKSTVVVLVVRKYFKTLTVSPAVCNRSVVTITVNKYSRHAELFDEIID